MTVGHVEQLAAALQGTGVLIAGITSGQWSNPTPCADWDVRALVGHLVAGNRLFAGALAGEDVAPGSAPAADIDAEEGWSSRYRDSCRELLGAFSRPGALDRVVEVPVGSVPGAVALHLRITEALVHGWDLAQATAQPVLFPDELAQAELEFTRGALGLIPPGRRPFGRPQPVPEDASAIDRLAALLGRSPSGGDA